MTKGPVAKVNDDVSQRRIMVIGSPLWTSRTKTMETLSRVMDTFKGPYVLITDRSDGAGKWAAAVAEDLGWKVEPYEYDPTKCAKDCPKENHRRPGGPRGDWCPTARLRNVEKMSSTGLDLCVTLVFGDVSAIRRDGTKEIKAAGIACWDVTQSPGRRSNGER